MAKGLATLALLGTVTLGLGAAALRAEEAEVGCNAYNPLKTMFTDVCWSGMFPIRVSGATFKDGDSGVPEDATNQTGCACGGDLAKGELPKIGFTVGFWSPAKIIDVTRKPYCFASLNGLVLPLDTIDFLNSGGNSGRPDRHEAFGNWVMYASPLVFMLKLLDDGACPPDGLLDFDILHMSPTLPNWNDVVGRYTVFLNPEMTMLANVKAMFAMPVDAIASTLGNPMNNLFWVAGAWGAIYPLTGFDGTGRMVDPVRFTSLIAVRSMSLLYRLAMLHETIGDENLCERNPRFIIRKDAFRWQMLAPSPEMDGRPEGAPPPVESTTMVREVNPKSSFGTCTHPTGSSTAAWGMWRDVPAIGEDHSYMIFQWTDCCFGFTPGG